ncbi:HAD family hydrolase [Candidatus Gottesmanbacteria bacterium]|nr:HAD family hydrolase [Candidatus Gottesmanbacteria bacterium]
MDKRFDDVKILIWDFDGTLYKPNPALFHKVREAEYRVIAERMHWPKEKVITEFNRVWPKLARSATEAVARIAGITTVEAAIEMESYYDRRPYLSHDRKLIGLFSKLSHFTHYLLVNGIRKRIEESLNVLGMPVSTFADIVTSESVGVNKPNPAGFKFILAKTTLPSSQHLMIGDRPAVDLAPAKKLGMQTCLVWAKSSAAYVDVILPSVYDVANLLR